MYFEIDDEALVLKPTETDFKDFIGYTKKVKCITEKHGICIVRPPKNWRPTFVIDLDQKLFSLKNDVESSRKYSIYEYGDMADDFKMNFFHRPVDEVNPSEIENCFWSSNLDEISQKMKEVDDFKMSGFPSRNSKQLSNEDKEFVNSLWNLNNTNSRCLLKYLNNSSYTKRNRMSSLEMCFSHQPWRIEEAFAFSLHYIQWGDSKTWYSIHEPNDELLTLLYSSEQPINKSRIDDLVKIHKVTRVRQKARDFVFIHPRTATFSLSHGFNFSERISFLPQEWLQHGHAYWKLCFDGRIPSFPFSYEEVVFKFLRGLKDHGSVVVAVLRRVVSALIEREMDARKKLPKMSEEQKIFEVFLEDLRICHSCHKIAFMSVIFCKSCNKASCPQCYLESDWCCIEEENRSLLWRFSEEELKVKLKVVLDRAEQQDEWMNKATRMINGDDDDSKMSIEELHKLKDDAITLSIEDMTLRSKVIEIVRSSEEIRAQVDALFSPVDEGDEHNSEELENNKKRIKPSLIEVKKLLEDMKASRCKNDKMGAIEEVIDGIESFIKDVGELLTQCPLPSAPIPTHAIPNDQLPWQPQPPEAPKVMMMMMTMIDFKKTKTLLLKSKKVLVDVGESTILEQYYNRCDWIRNVQSALDKLSTSTNLDGLQKLIGHGTSLCDEDGPLYEVTQEVVTFLQGHIQYFKDLDRIMKESLDSTPHRNMSDLKDLVEASKKFPKISFSNLPLIKKVLQEALVWEGHVGVLLNGQERPYIHDIKNHLVKGRTIPVILDSFDQLENNVKICELWMAEASKLFLKNSSDDLLEVLAPRMNILEPKNSKKGGKKKRLQMLLELLSIDPLCQNDAIKAMKVIEAAELEEVMILRKLNGDKLLSEESKYCFCKQGRSGDMLECRVCRELYHESCLEALNNNKENNPSSLLPPLLAQTAPLQTMPDAQGVTYPITQLHWRFMCPSCHRSKRPSLKELYYLMNKCVKLPFLLAEERFVERIANRMLTWQIKVNKYMKPNEQVRSAARQLGNIFRDLTREMGLQTPEQIEIDKFREKYKEEYRILYKDRPPQPKENISEDIMKHLELLQVEGDILEASEWQTLKLEEMCITYKHHVERMGRKENEVLNSTTPMKDLNSTNNNNNTNNNNTNKTNATKKKKKKHEDDTNKPKKITKKSKPMEVGSAKIRFYPLFKNKNLISKNTKKGTNLHGNTEEDEDDIALPATSQITSRHPLFPVDDVLRNDEEDGGDDNDDDSDDDGDDDWKMKEHNVRGEAKDEDLEDCSARVCLKPMGKEVDWVQCDTCSRWFHLQCIGLSIRDVSEEDEFECKSCRDHR